MLPEEELEESLASIPPRPLTGRYTRCIAYGVLHATSGTPQPLFAGTSDSRFSSGGVTRLYLACDPVVALQEVLQVFSILTVPGRDFVSRFAETQVLIPVDVELRYVLDLFRDDVREALATDVMELTGIWTFPDEGERATQRLGRVVASTKHFSAIRYPSSKAPERDCLVVFPDSAAVLEAADALRPLFAAAAVPPEPG